MQGERMKKQPGQVSFNPTPAMRKALIATNDQQVFRLYGAEGSLLKSERKGIAPRVLWSALVYRFIEDEPGTRTGSMIVQCRMRLTKAGLAVLGKKA